MSEALPVSVQPVSDSMTCLGGNRCEQATSMVRLVTGQEVCNWCPEWALECEARRLLVYPMAARREALVKRDFERGKEATDRLRDVMTAVHAADKGKRP